MSTQNTITLVSVADNHFITLLAALTKSIDVNHHSGELIDYYIVDDNISSANKKRLQNGLMNSRLKINWVPVNAAVPSMNLLPMDNSSFPLSIYIRLFISYFIPKEVDRLIYLDADMLVLEDISKLWHTNLENKIVAGVVDRAKVISSNWGGIKNYKELGLSPDTRYFNTGVMVINLYEWRRQNITERVLQCITENRNFLNFPDQYGLNVVFANQWHELDGRWNCISMGDEKNPFIIHFIDRKPIFKGYNFNESYKQLFFSYLNLTDWKNYKPKSEFSRLSKKLYNVITKKIKRLFYTTIGRSQKKNKVNQLIQVSKESV